MFVDAAAAGIAMVPPGPGNGRDSTLLAGTGVVSITGGASATVVSTCDDAGASAAGGAGGGAGSAAGAVITGAR
jgi:hypothetical protein